MSTTAEKGKACQTTTVNTACCGFTQPTKDDKGVKYFAKKSSDFCSIISGVVCLGLDWTERVFSQCDTAVSCSLRLWNIMLCRLILDFPD